MISLMVEITSNLINKWTLSLNKTKNELTSDIKHDMTRLTLDIVTGCEFGSGLMKHENVRDVICRNVTTTLQDVERRLFNTFNTI
jgi:hypothetical protein